MLEKRSLINKRINAPKVFLFLLILLPYVIFSQSIKLKGRVLDSVQKPLSYANIILESIENSKISFAIADEDGKYQIKLLKNQRYKLKVSYLGYKSKNIFYMSEKDSTYNFVLKENAQILGEVIIDSKLAVSIKKDTITYQTDKFVTDSVIAKFCLNARHLLQDIIYKSIK